MAQTYDETTLVASYPTSPRPRRLPMTSLSTNQRSYSRMSSKGIFGDESPLLLSPLPKYPNRRRSITFADETEATVREERPCYTVWDVAATPNAQLAESPSKRTVPKPTSGEQRCLNAAATHAYGGSTVAAPKSPTPKRARSNSRQRRAVRRQQAQLHHGFYDDSIVEDYVLKIRKELEDKEEQRRLEEKLEQQEKEKAEAENKAAQATVKINALQQAKEYLLSTANTRHVSPVCSSSERHDGVSVSRSRNHATKKEMDLVQHQQQSDEEIEAIEEALRQKSTKSTNRSMPLVTRANEGDAAGSKKRLRDSSSKKGGRSVPLVQGLHIDDDDDDGDTNEGNDGDGHDGDAARRKKAKLERIIARVIEQQAKRRHGKRSVVVIDWDCAESEELPLDDDDDDAAEAAERHVVVTAPRCRKAPSLKHTDNVVKPTQPPQKQQQQQQRRQTPAARTTSVRRAPSKKRNDSVSEAPDLGEDSLLLEEDQPVLLRRPTTKRRVPTRSISHLSADTDDDAVFAQAADVSHKPPQRAVAPKTARRGRKAAAAAVPPSPPAPPAPRTFTSTRHDPFVDVEAVAPPQAPATTRIRRGPAAKPPIPVASADDPMAVFYSADFPSPSKFEEMLLAAGGVPELRRAGRGQQRQPALLLPDSISRRR
ncbi:putative dynein heavy chain [Trypanosoma grayi]|uniref:putative dynein heavy chain n=1 Tax=Trypanosoma grayi TaxID=71804 RepID=UPI0004F401BC|nr:putative dynein heavy chain [Trypanosoma grayi]KEG15114.1 putative dynein heavy chain [Trypanosoma grayi]